MYMAEDYNSPQSVYWALKTLIAVGLADDDDFWASDEVSYPTVDSGAKIVSAPQQILCNHPEGSHHFMLTPGQFVAWPMKANQAKYCKFAYSSAFGFSVPTGPLIQQIAPDNQLAISRDGAETWTVKWKCEDVQFNMAVTNTMTDEDPSVPIASVGWYPWGDRSVHVDTILIPPTDRWPDWHVRVHRIKSLKGTASIHTVEGGFAIYGRKTTDGTNLSAVDLTDEAVPGQFEGFTSTDNSTLIASKDGVSGIVIEAVSDGNKAVVSSSALKPDANTNLVRQRTLIPTASVSVPEQLAEGTEMTIMTSVFAISTRSGRKWESSGLSLKQSWLDRPKLDLKSLKQHAVWEP